MVFGRLVVLKKDGSEGAFFDITSDITIGRGTDCDIRVKMPSISRLQSRILIDENGHCNIENLSATNPTVLNGESVAESVVLKHMDEINIGGRLFTFQHGEKIDTSTIVCACAF